MKKIAIKFIFEDEEQPDDLKSIAQELQRFIIDGEYKLSIIMHKIITGEMLVLDIGMENPMPLFEDAIDGFDEEELDYVLYKQSPKNPDSWEEIAYEKLSLELDRTPKWLYALIGFNLIWLVVMTFLQFVPIYKFYDEKYEMGTLLTIMSSFITGIVPLFNSIIAYLGAMEFYDWERSNALFAFFGYYIPLLLFLIYLLWILIKGIYAQRWYRFWRPEFN